MDKQNKDLCAGGDPRQVQQPMVPGFGVAGTTMCPLMSVTHAAPCMKQGCELWTELQCGEYKVARCALVWIPVVATETRQAIAKLSAPVDKKEG